MRNARSFAILLAPVLSGCLGTETTDTIQLESVAPQLVTVRAEAEKQRTDNVALQKSRDALQLDLERSGVDVSRLTAELKQERQRREIAEREREQLITVLKDMRSSQDAATQRIKEERDEARAREQTAVARTQALQKDVESVREQILDLDKKYVEKLTMRDTEIAKQRRRIAELEARARR